VTGFNEKAVSSLVACCFPRVHLGVFPTPLQHARRLGEKAGHKSLYIKRDDMTGLGLGGNKTRNLEFLLGDALSKGSNTIIAQGGLQSNLCALTAAACAKLGLKCILVHNDDPPEEPEGNQVLNRAFGARQHFVGKVPEDARTKAAEVIAEECRLRGDTPYIIYNGGSTPLGCLGYVEAAAELYHQAQAMGIALRHVTIVGAMGGTAAGFIIGTALLGHPFHVHVISVEYPKERLSAIIAGLIEKTIDLLGTARGTIPRILAPDVARVYDIYDEYLGEGYGIPTKASREAAFTLAHTEGILVEEVYTSKTLAGLLDLIAKEVISRQESACYIHTGGIGAFFAQDRLPAY